MAKECVQVLETPDLYKVEGELCVQVLETPDPLVI
jgi:hypothetical protein